MNRVLPILFLGVLLCATGCGIVVVPYRKTLDLPGAVVVVDHTTYKPIAGAKAEFHYCGRVPSWYPLKHEPPWWSGGPHARDISDIEVKEVLVASSVSPGTLAFEPTKRWAFAQLWFPIGLPLGGVLYREPYGFLRISAPGYRLLELSSNCFSGYSLSWGRPPGNGPPIVMSNRGPPRVFLTKMDAQSRKRPRVLPRSKILTDLLAAKGMKNCIETPHAVSVALLAERVLDQPWGALKTPVVKSAKVPNSSVPALRDCLFTEKSFQTRYWNIGGFPDYRVTFLKPPHRLDVEIEILSEGSRVIFYADGEQVHSYRHFTEDNRATFLKLVERLLEEPTIGKNKGE